MVAKHGEVSIHGKVRSAEEKALAESAVKDIGGVRHVRNFLQVVPPAVAETVQFADDEITKQVEEALKAEPLLEGSDISVEVNNGVVLLSGESRSLAQILRAVELTLQVRGVRRVASDVDSPDGLRDR